MKLKILLIFFLTIWLISCLITSVALAIESSQEVKLLIELEPLLAAPEITTPTEQAVNTESTTVIKGTAEPNSTVIIYDANTNQQIGQTTADENGNWTISYEVPQPGTYKIYGKSIDKLGNQSQPSRLITFYYEKKYRPRWIATHIKSKKQIYLLTAAKTITKILKISPASEKKIVKTSQVINNAFPFAAGGIVAYSAAVNLLAIPWADLLLYLLQPLISLLEFLGLRKKRKPWGTVYDSRTKLPLSYAIVRLFDAETKKLIESRVTDKEGRYGFLVPSGKFYLTVTKLNYVFPSKIVTGKVDLPFDNIYHGETLSLGEAFININIPVDFVATFDVTQKFKPTVRKVSNILYKLRLPTLIIGTIISLVFLFTRSQMIDVISILFYGFLWTADFKVMQKKLWGRVYNSKTKKPIEKATVRIFDKEFNKLLETMETDAKGRYVFLAKQGAEYYLVVSKENFQFPSKMIKKKKDKGYTNLYFGQPFSIVKKEETVIKFDIPLDPAS